MFCTNCGASLSEQSKFCNQCGQAAKTPAPGRLCLSCGTPLAQGTLACAACSARHRHCTECGALGLEASIGCPNCGRLPRLPAGYEILPSEYEHPSMQPMNQTLRRSVVLNRLAEGISQKIGKPWYESCFNSVETTEKQYGRVHEVAMIAAQRMGFIQAPSVYIEADRGYQSNTYGSEKDAFVNIGTFLPKLLTDRELLFVMGHEFGHLKAHHALWMTVSMFLVGQTRGNLMSEGILSYVSNPLKIIESGVESMIMNWMRVADLTADRAALLIGGDFSVAIRTLFLMYFKSRKELDEVNIDEWTKQQEAQASGMTKFSQLMTSSTPYLGLRLRALQEFYESPRYAALRSRIETGSGLDLDGLFDHKGYLKKFAKPVKGPDAASGPSGQGRSAPSAVKVISGSCPHCKAAVRIPLQGLPVQGTATITCPQCRQTFSLDVGRILGLKPQASKPAPPQDKAEPRKVKVAEGECPKCKAHFRVPMTAMPNKPVVDLKCRNCGQKFRLNLGPVLAQDAQERARARKGALKNA